MPAPAEAHERVGGYELLEQIGRGGMGVVFRARDLRLNRVVALKLILTGKLASEAEVKRFRAEAEAAAQLEHPNIVPIYEVGESEGRHFFAMKFMEGESMAEWKSGFRPPGSERPEASPNSRNPEIATLVAKIARAIHHAHQRGILHRDIKPGNILLDAEGEPAVTDFGLAKRLTDSEPGTRNLELTLSGAAVGSPSYMAPEQASGRSREVTTAADVYSLGAVLFHLLTGRAPFAEESAMATMRAVIEREPPRPSTLNHDIDRDLETICLKCLEKEPARRYASAAELADDLDRWRMGKPIFARPTGPAERTFKWIRRHPAWAALIGFGAVALAAFVTMQSLNEARLRREKDFAQKQESSAKASEAAMRLNLYASDMFLAARALEQGNLGLARRTLAAHIPRADEEDLRGFEWRHYWHVSQGQQERVLGGFSNAVNCVVFSSDGQWLAAGGGDVVQKWNATNGALVATFRHEPGTVVNSLAFSPDGSSIWAGESKGKIRIWLDGMSKPIGEFTRGTGWVHIAAPAGVVGKVAVSERNGTDGKAHGAVALYSFMDLLRRNERGNVLPKSGGLAAFSRDGEWLLTGGGQDPALRHNLKSGDSRPLPGWTGILMALALSPDGSRAAVSPNNGTAIGLVDFRSDPPLRTAISIPWRCRALAFSPDGETLAAASFDHTIRLLHASFGDQTHRLDGHSDQVLAVAYSPDGRTLASAGADGTVRLWDLTAVNRNEVSGIFPPFILSDDGQILYAGNTDEWRSSLMRHDLSNPVRTPEPLLRLRADRFPDLTRQHNGLVRWRVHGGATPQQWAKLESFVGRDTNRVVWRSGLEGQPNSRDRIAERVKDISASAADGSVLAMADGKKVRLWHTFTSTRLPDLQSPPKEVRQMALSADGRVLAVFAGNNVISVWDTAHGTNLYRLPPRASAVNDLVFSPDGATLALAGEDSTVQLLDAPSGRLRATLTGHDVGVMSVAFSWDGRTLVSVAGSWLKLWHLPTLREVGTLRLNADHIAFSRDDTVLVAVGWHGHGRLLRAPR